MNFDNYESISDSKRLEVATNFKLYVPLGLIYRLSNKSNLLRYVHLFAKGQMGLEGNRMAEINTNLGFNRGIISDVRILLNESKT